MIYPDGVFPGAVVGITAPSDGIGRRLEDFTDSERTLESLGYSIRETANVRSLRCPSTSARKRAREFNELAEDSSVQMIFSATGGDFLMEMLPYIKWEALRKNPKWVEGMSDPSTILYILPTKYDVATLYGFNAGSYHVKQIDRQLSTNLAYWKKDFVKQDSYDRYQPDISADHYDPVFPEVVNWKTPNGPVNVDGRMIGGCIDALRDIVGTPFDDTCAFVERYKEDGIIWFFDVYAYSSEDFYHTLFQMKECGWFAYTKAVVLGRVLFPKTFTNVTYEKAVKKIFGSRIPLILDADIGHTNPSMVFVNGGYARVEAGEGKGSVQFFEK